MTLTELGILHQTDKSTFHGYTDTYDHYLTPIRWKAKKILEVGIAAGASLKMWADYFENATIFGVDHNEQSFINCPKHPFIQPVLGEASDRKFWIRFKELWGGDLDFCCDDGSHHASATIETFRAVWPLMAPGSLYAIEDTHTSYDPEYNRTPNYETTMQFLFNRVNDMNEYGSGQTGQPSRLNPIASIHFHKSLCIVRKRAL